MRLLGQRQRTSFFPAQQLHELHVHISSLWPLSPKEVTWNSPGGCDTHSRSLSQLRGEPWAWNILFFYKLQANLIQRESKPTLCSRVTQHLYLPIALFTIQKYCWKDKTYHTTPYLMRPMDNCFSAPHWTGGPGAHPINHCAVITGLVFSIFLILRHFH